MGESAHRRVTVLRWGGQGTLPGGQRGSGTLSCCRHSGSPAGKRDQPAPPQRCDFGVCTQGMPLLPSPCRQLPSRCQHPPAMPSTALLCGAVLRVTSRNFPWAKTVKKKPPKTPLSSKMSYSRHIPVQPVTAQSDGQMMARRQALVALQSWERTKRHLTGGCYGNVCLLRAKQKNRNAFRWSHWFTTRGVEGCCTAGSGLQWRPSAPHLAPPAGCAAVGFSTG